MHSIIINLLISQEEESINDTLKSNSEASFKKLQSKEEI